MFPYFPLVFLLEPGDRAIRCINGVFGNRMADVAGRYGAEVPWSQPIGSVDVKKALNAGSGAALVGIVRVETSTGVLQLMDKIGAIC